MNRTDPIQVLDSVLFTGISELLHVRGGLPGRPAAADPVGATGQPPTPSTAGLCLYWAFSFCRSDTTNRRILLQRLSAVGPAAPPRT